MGRVTVRLPFLIPPEPSKSAFAMTTAPPESSPSEPTPPPLSDPADPDPSGSSQPRSALFTSVVLVVAIASIGLLALFSGTEDTVDDAATAGDAGDIMGLAFTTAEGGSGSLSDYHGEPLVVNFFASWCPPCRAELPDFEAVHQNVGDQVTFVGINQDFTEETWRAFVAEAQVTYDTVFQPNSEIWNELGTGAMPTTAFISADGELVQVWAGLLTDDKLIELIDEHLVEDGKAAQ